MHRTGIATLPLHHGKAPRWLFERMVSLAREIAVALISEFGRIDFLRKLSDPYWFQALGCVLGFDWHSSGLTTTSTGALKEALRGLERDTGIFIAGGKGAISRKTPEQIRLYSDRFGINPDPLIYASRLSAKVDNSALQDGYQLYHHIFVFTPEGYWAVIQQGMNQEAKRARRYHWLSERVKDFVNEPHSAICSQKKHRQVLNLVAEESSETRQVCVQLASQKPERTIQELEKISHLNLSSRHDVTVFDIDPQRLHRVLLKTYERLPADFEQLLSIEGVGPKTLRALSLIAELIYGKPPSFKDPARFSFAHGGKDGTPYPVDRKTYDRTIEIIKKAVEASRLGHREKLDAIKRLAFIWENSNNTRTLLR
ncbi:MAG: DUF763 domain-containing protein [Thermodesulfovibrionales bacterium]|nr:DUF763 domain-containing protein [Thermodesulfovibrionales bacterium]